MKNIQILAILVTLTILTESVDVTKFKKCEDSSFCNRQRNTNVRDYVQYQLLPNSLNFDHGRFEATIVDVLSDTSYQLLLVRYADQVVRLTINEVEPLHPRYQVENVVLVDDSDVENFDKYEDQVLYYGDFKIEINIENLALNFYNKEELVISTNNRNMFYFEYLREKPINPEPETNENDDENEESEGNSTEDIIIKEDEKSENEPIVENVDQEFDFSDAWSSKFKKFTDDAKYGPQSIGLDFSFIGSGNVYGIPEHATDFSLKSTKGENAEYSDPYRLYNLDVFEFDLDVPMSLYGSIPFMVSHTVNTTSAILWLNAAETWIDIEKQHKEKGFIDSLFGSSETENVHTHWMSETGIIDVFFFMGPSPKDIMRQYTYITGKPYLPPVWSIAYHQCRWNYLSDREVFEVNENFELHDIPYDVLWLDIEHTDGKKYFTWDDRHFPKPTEMINNISSFGRKMVTIVDPHIKRESNYYIHTEAEKNSLYVKDKDGKDFEGWCWPGSSSWMDYFDPTIQEWWAQQFAYDKYIGSTEDLYTWNDMNEPSVFNGPETTMEKSNIHYGGWEHRDVHNIYGMLMQKATLEGLVNRNQNKDKRGFVLSRAFYSGTQRYGAVWTGDNAAEWSHLDSAQPMLLSLSISGLAFSGADVGGFFGNPEPELLARWYQVGAYQPFFRGHAHLDAKRREPWVHGEPWTTIIGDAIRSRYKVLPYLYTCFYEASIEGYPVMRPLWFEFPQDKATFAIQDQFLVGNALLVKPIVQQNIFSTVVYFPGDTDDIWYDYTTFSKHNPGESTVSAPLEKIPVFQRGGSIIPLKTRVRRSSTQMINDPYTLQIALDKNNQAKGDIYIDDESSFDYKNDIYSTSHLEFNDLTLIAQKSGGSGKFDRLIERIVIAGLSSSPVSVNLVQSGDVKSLEFKYENGVLTIKKPMVNPVDNWEISLK
eukprot:TRINITY_DN6435_c0_g1_i1.p1 TRINITY_DN6435_c0_g1~~TRINITY_DN6435_c0_g1_i1.p1  ORF type:complete len:943 (+),score=212.21 TRINITY_DN6435_c0_g1_i1:24-2831(+)